VLLAIRFKVEGSLRFLSHAETLRVFQRACIRAGLRIRYSEGFNPRPKLSLPLPRPVGVESDDELFCLRVTRDPLPSDDAVEEQPNTGNESRIKDALARQLPEGCELISVVAVEPGVSFVPRSVAYVLPIRPEYLTEELQATMERLSAAEHLVVQRTIHKGDSKSGHQAAKSKNVDVKGFLKSLKLADKSIIAACKISPAGSVRVDEILKLLGLSEGMLAGPIRRTSVQWQNN
jgi:radical SAM-linked protein